MRLVLVLTLLPFCLTAQTIQPANLFPQRQINNVLHQAWQMSQVASPPISNAPKTSNIFTSGAYQFLKKYRLNHIAIPNVHYNTNSRSSNNDTLFVGANGNDTLVVTGTWQNSGPIYVVNNGVLIFKNATATILGDIFVIQNGQLFAINSTLYIPQQYFYQRALITAQNASVVLKDGTMNFGGLTHNFLLLDSSRVTVQNVHFTDWTTTGLNNKSVFTIDTCNTIGEIILEDSINLTVKNTDTVLLWHQIPKGAGLTWMFPNGVSLTHYSLTPTSPGVTGLKYTVEADNCKLAWWALMPVDGSDVKISNSSLRAIGAWFTGTDTTIVQSLADNSNYITSGNLFDDRTLILDTTSVTTWSLYPMDKTMVTIKSCIAGEIGSENGANTSCISSFVDGSGGYFWATDTSLQVGELCGFTSNVRSEGTGFVLVAYSSIGEGMATGIATSILFLVQTVVLQQPIAYDGSDVWVAQISTPSTAFVNDNVPIPGSAYILRGPISQWMSFSHYKLFYQAAGSTIWRALTGNDSTAVTQNNLALWNTTGLAAGNYSLMLTVYDNYNDSVSANTSITLLPAVLNGIKQIDDANTVSAYPNPASNQLTVNSNHLIVKEIRIYNLLGQTILDYPITFSNEALSPCCIEVDVSNLPTGVYFYQITTTNSQLISGKFLKE